MNEIKLIAETAWHHNGDFNFFKRLVEEIAIKTKANYIKFHITMDLDEYMHKDHPAYSWTKERMFKEEQWDEILNLALKHNKKIMLLFNDKKAIDFGIDYNPEIVEIHSVCLNDFNLLKYLNSKIKGNMKIVLGVGGSNLYEIENALSIIESKNVVFMHGFQNYPTKYEDINFGKILKIKYLYPNYEHGYADHTAWDNENNILITLLGASLGMQYIEKHVTIVYGEERVDWQAAISIEMFNEIAEKLKVVEQTYGDAKLKLNAGEKMYSTFGYNKKAAILTKDVKKGEVFTNEHYTFKRTGQKSDLSQIDILEKVGDKFSKNLPLGHCLNSSDFERN